MAGRRLTPALALAGDRIRGSPPDPAPSPDGVRDASPGRRDHDATARVAVSGATAHADWPRRGMAGRRGVRTAAARPDRPTDRPDSPRLRARPGDRLGRVARAGGHHRLRQTFVSRSAPHSRRGERDVGRGDGARRGRPQVQLRPEPVRAGGGGVSPALSEQHVVVERSRVRGWYILGSRAMWAGPRFDIRRYANSPVFTSLDPVPAFQKTGGVLIWRGAPLPRDATDPPAMSWVAPDGSGTFVYVSADVAQQDQRPIVPRAPPAAPRGP